jgi:hypothetical protein
MADLDLTPDMEHADVAGWIMGALDPLEHRRFRVHLESCADCQRTVAEFAPAAQKLATALPDRDLLATANPPADLQERTLARVRQAAANGQPDTDIGTGSGTDTGTDTGSGTDIGTDTATATGTGTETATGTGTATATGTETATGTDATPIAPRRRRQGARLISIAAAALVAVGAAAAFVVTQSAPALAFSIPLHGQNGSAATAQATAHQATGGWSIQLTARHLKPLGRGKFYECWYTSRAHHELITAGTFTVASSGTVSVQMWSAADPRTFPVMEITIETAGDAGQHGTVILRGTARR